MYVKYNCDFYGLNDTKWRINIMKRTGGGSVQYFDCTSEGFVLSMDGKDDDLLAPIKTSSVTFNMVVPVGSVNESIFDDLNSVATDNENEFIVALYRYHSGDWRRYWFGVMLSDLAEIADDSPNRIVKIKAVDGLTKLKYKQLKTGTDGYNGDRSLMNIIKICLRQIPTADDDFGLFDTTSSDTETFIAHTPFYYTKGMDLEYIGGQLLTPNLNQAWREDVKHDPLTLIKVNMSIFQDRDGKPWTYYKILEQILACFHLRIMMTPIKNDTVISPNFAALGDCVWFIQAPYVFHNDDDNADYMATQLIMYHNKDITSATANDAIGYADYANDVIPETRAAGGLETSIPPLLTYKSIYSHNQFNSVAISLDNWSSVNHQNGTTNYFSKGGDVWGGLDMQLTGQENIPANGWVSPAERTARQRILVTGEVILYPIDVAHNQTGGLVGYISAGEYFNQWYEDSYWTSGYGIYEVNDSDFWVFPRLGLRVYTISDAILADGTNNGTTVANYWLYNNQFIMLFGSVPWARTNGQAYHTDQYPNNFKGADSTDEGLRFNLSLGTDPDTNATIYQNSSNQAIWSAWWDEQVGWWKGDLNSDTGTDEPNDNHWAYFSPVFYNDSISILNYGTTWGSSNDTWASGQGMFTGGQDFISQPFTFMSDRIPWDRIYSGDATDNYGASRISQIEFYYGFRRDQVIDSSGVAHYVCCKDWDRNHREYAYNRGIHWAYSLNNVRVYVLGIMAGADSYDASFGISQNDNGVPSEEEVQSPEIIIGDEPEFNPFANDDDLQGFGGDYVGQFKIYNASDSVGTPNGNTGNDYIYLPIWGTIHQLTVGYIPATEPNQDLHEKRARVAVCNRVQLKRKLDLKLIDTTTDYQIEQSLFSQIYRFSSGEWSLNQSSATVAYMPSGGQFVAGTGSITITAQDCVTYNKTNITDKSYSSNG